MGEAGITITDVPYESDGLFQIVTWNLEVNYTWGVTFCSTASLSWVAYILSWWSQFQEVLFNSVTHEERSSERLGDWHCSQVCKVVPFRSWDAVLMQWMLPDSTTVLKPLSSLIKSTPCNTPMKAGIQNNHLKDSRLLFERCLNHPPFLAYLFRNFLQD